MVSPCSSTDCPAGVVAGSPVCQRRSTWEPPRSHEETVGIAPPVIAWRSRGSLTPSSWTTSRPRPGRPCRWVLRTAWPRTCPKKASSLLASKSQFTAAAATAEAHEATTTWP